MSRHPIRCALFMFASYCVAAHVWAGHCLADDGGGVQPRFVFQDDERWRTTSVSNALEQGDPATLTWSIIPDGTPIFPRSDAESDEPSNLNSLMTSLHGDDWHQIVTDVFDRYSSISGLTYLEEINDDGAAIREYGYSVGDRGVRADIRIGGHAIDDGSQLAYNYFPPNGDMVLDTSDNFLTDRSRVYNLIAHEHGHGLGLRHIHSKDSRPLMQPFISTDFQGPQFDDILGLHRLFGDALEKQTGNDSQETAFDLGEYRPGAPLVIGDDAIQTRVAFTQTDFVSIDGASDVDFFQFSLSTTATASILLEPSGPKYYQGTSFSDQSLFDAARQSDLTLQLFRVGSPFPVATSADTEIGGAESIEKILLGAGDYRIRISGKQDAAQMYRLTVGEIPHTPQGDFDRDGDLDVDDVQQLIDQSRSGVFDPDLDLNSDDILDERDLEFWVHDLKNSFFGDSDLDGDFDSTDLVMVFTAAQYEDSVAFNSTWATGDWNGDGDFGSRDLIAAFQEAAFEKGLRVVPSVPEPTGHIWWMIAILGVAGPRQMANDQHPPKLVRTM